jgi:TetR/AcrR family transcriptional regulator, transcriptional repressor of aconitase
MDARRREILDGARRAFAKHGYEGATVEKLEQEIGLSRGAIFHHFPSKFDLFFALAQEDQQQAAKQWIEDGFEPLLRRIAAENPDWIGVYLEVARMLRTDEGVRTRWIRKGDEHDALLLERMRELQARGVVRDDLDPNDVGRFLGIVIDGVALSVAARVPVDVEPVIRLVNDALAPRE